MRVIKNTKRTGKIKGSVLTLGNFDGLHLGHRKIRRAPENSNSHLSYIPLTRIP